MRGVLIGAIAVTLLSVGSPLKALPEQQENNPPQTAVAIPLYPESEDGLKTFIGDIFGAMKSGDNRKASMYFSNLMLPDPGTWFTKTFGPVEGPRLETKYEMILREPNGNMQEHFEFALKGGNTNVEVRVLREPLAPGARMGRAILDSMAQPVLVYLADGTNPSGKFPTSIGDFVYADGGFRFLDPQVFTALSTAPPIRIRVGGNVQAAKIVHKVSPIYPDSARAAHIGGTVVFHVVIGIDGKIKELMPTSGDPSLSKAAADALQQWQYQPTLLNNVPVEVDTTVTLDFHIN